jgi:hypothetical protein
VYNQVLLALSLSSDPLHLERDGVEHRVAYELKAGAPGRASWRAVVRAICQNARCPDLAAAAEEAGCDLFWSPSMVVAVVWRAEVPRRPLVLGRGAFDLLDGSLVVVLQRSSLLMSRCRHLHLEAGFLVNVFCVWRFGNSGCFEDP